MSRAMDALLAEKALVEEQNARLTTLVVSGQRLQEATKREDVVSAIEEIVANLLGSEEVAVFVVDEGAAELRLVGASGVDVRPLARIPLGAGLIGGAAQRGERWITDGGPLPQTASAHESGLTACVPLRFGAKVTGAVAIFRLLPQKGSLEPGDEDLLAMLETAGATALALAERQSHAEGIA
jgi:hypothetical protein